MRHRTVAILLALTTLVPLAVAPVVAWAKGPTTASKVRGRWTDPVGACAGHVVSLDPATGAIVCTRTSRWTGTWNGSTKWTLTRILDPSSAAVSGRVDEVFTGDAAGGRAGTLTFVESLSIDASGGTSIRGHITNSSGALAGSSGHASWIGISAQDGSGSGTYSRRWREGHRRGACYSRGRGPSTRRSLACRTSSERLVPTDRARASPAKASIWWTTPGASGTRPRREPAGLACCCVAVREQRSTARGTDPLRSIARCRERPIQVWLGEAAQAPASDCRFRSSLGRP